MDLKGSKTEKNLAFAFAGESQARNKYTYFASKAKKDGYEQIAAFFLETADNEKEHAKLWFKHLGGIGSTVENLKAAADANSTIIIKCDPNVKYRKLIRVLDLCSELGLNSRQLVDKVKPFIPDPPPQRGRR